MADFIKQTLQKTKISENNLVVGKSAGGKYIPPAPIKENIRNNTGIEKPNFKKIKSKVRQNLEE